MLTIAVLGEVEATRDGVRLPVPSGKTTDLLVRLAVHPGTPVRVDTLIEDLWGEPVDRNTLQAKVSQLRRALGDKDAVSAHGDAYLLDVSAERVDAAAVAMHTQEASAAAARREYGAAAAAAAAGIALFRGDPLVGQRDWAAPLRTALAETRWSLVELLAEARVALGGGGELVAELERLVDEEPLRERLWAALMTALYRAGRQADALAAYGRARRHLVDELGLEPGPQLRELEAMVLAQDADLTGAAGDDVAVAPTNLPRPRTPLAGRDRELPEVVELLAQPGVVTLVGPAGVGKTRLAVEAGHVAAPPGGAWMVRLDALPVSARMGDLLEAVAGVLHVAPRADALQDRLRGAPTLVVLDNCEHVVTAAAELVDWLRDAAPQVRVLATSQMALAVGDEGVVEVLPLPLGVATDLFEQLVARQQRRPAPRNDLGADRAGQGPSRALVEEVCGSLDGLPLALELAAARVRSLPLHEVARRLGDRFALLRDPSRPADRRHALAAALSWSYDLLFPDDQRALQALSCFAGGATLPAVEAVMAALRVPSTAVPDTLARLVERSLTVLDTSMPVPRYRLLDSVRTHAFQHLEQAGDLEAAQHAHAGWYADRAQECEGQIRGPAQPSWLDFVRSERADTDAALAWASLRDAALAERIAVGLGWAWAVLGDGSVAASRLRSAVGPGAVPDVRARAALAAAWLEASAGDLELAHEDLEVAAQALAELGQADGLDLGLAEAGRGPADLAWTRAFVAIQDGRPADVMADAERALAGYRELDAGWECGAAMVLLAYGSLMVGDAAAAGAHASSAIRLIEDSGDLWGLVHARGILAGVAAGEGRFAEAAELFDAAAGAASTMGFAGQAALHLASRARILVTVGDPAAGDAVAGALEAAATVGDGRLASGLRVHAAQLARAAGEKQRARELLQANEEWFAGHGGGDKAAVTTALLLAMDDDEQALTEFLTVESGAAARQVALDALARLAVQVGDDGRATELMGDADAVVVPAPDVVLRLDRPASPG